MDKITVLTNNFVTLLYSYSSCLPLVILSTDEVLTTTTKESHIDRVNAKFHLVTTELNYEIFVISNRHMGEFDFIS
jgi:hypothetical protein